MIEEVTDSEAVEAKIQKLRLLEALLFASAAPIDEEALAQRVGPEVRRLLDELRTHYLPRGVNLVRTGNAWAFRTATDLAPFMRVDEEVARKLSRAAVETLAIIAYHQPVTRAEIESIRAVATSKGTLDLLMENNWVRPGRRRETPGRPLTWVTTDHFLDHFGLETLRDLPGVEDLRAAGLLDSRPVLYGVNTGGEEATAPATADADTDDE
jgi:segregation and condensation protein B